MNVLADESVERQIVARLRKDGHPVLYVQATLRHPGRRPHSGGAAPARAGTGLYLAHIHDDLFELEVPDDFQPRRFDRPVMQPA